MGEPLSSMRSTIKRDGLCLLPGGIRRFLRMPRRKRRLPRSPYSSSARLAFSSSWR